MEEITNDCNEILKYLRKNNAMLIEQAQAEINEMRRNEMLSKHPFAVWETCRDGKVYYATYVYDASRPKNRRQVLRRNRKSLEDEIIKSIKESEAVTFVDLYNEYISRKVVNDSIKASTVHRYNNVFERHYVSTGMDKTDIRTLSAEEISDFLEDECGRCSLDSKGLSNLKGITTGILKRAMKRKLINYGYSTVYDYLDVRPRKKMKDNDSEIITDAELHAFIRYVVSNKTVINLSLLFMALSGLRVGEMTTLRFDDFESNTCFKVSRTETFYKNSDGRWVYEVSDRPKTAAGVRRAFLPSEYAWIVTELRAMNPFAEYVCTNENGDRIRSYSLRNHLRGICKKLPEFSQTKSPHKLRKTFCSILLDHGFDTNLIMSIAGHTNILTTEQYYHYDRKSSEKKQKLLDNVLDFKRVVNN